MYWHSDVIAGGDLQSGQYSGRMRAVLVEPERDPGRFDREWLLVLKEFEPHLRRTPSGFQVGYRIGTVNGRMLGHAEPLRARFGERALVHVLNASATQTRCIALPGHRFMVQSLDGQTVPTRAETSVLRLGPGERVSALVELNRPGKWILGDVSDRERERGMGVVVEYAGRRGAPEWGAPATDSFSYGQFGRVGRRANHWEQESIDLVFARHGDAERGFARWSVNGSTLLQSPSAPLAQIRVGRRCRFRLHNASDEPHTVHCPQQRLELAATGGRPVSGLAKDVLQLEPGQRIDVVVAALTPGPLLLRSVSPLQRDFGLLAPIACV
ncbi:MAG TPA: multicopper oxidase domain-containing protein [Steroidobacteraceae bacterium]|nr:multicopper oxidase domain-containing protein [Steroidobacteraceae bacterium]